MAKEVAARVENPRKLEPYELNFDLHRTGGLWLWALHLVDVW